MLFICQGVYYGLFSSFGCFFYTGSDGKKVISFVNDLKHSWVPMKLPCGRCVGCRLERSKQWAIRCVHESQLYKDNCFITLTFDNDHLDEDSSLQLRDFQLFMKRLRKQFVPPNPYEEGSIEYDDFQQSHAIRFFHCGEYGELNKRPHHHAIIFNFDFDDKYLWKRGTNPLWRSPTLEKLWPYGMSSIGKVTFESAAYVARYVMKKVNGELADEHYANEFGFFVS